MMISSHIPHSASAIARIPAVPILVDDSVFVHCSALTVLLEEDAKSNIKN